MSETTKTLLLELLLSGFWGVAWIRAGVPVTAGGKLRFSSLLRLPGRLDRLQRTRWQWFAMVAFMVVLRLQGALPPILEGMALVEFILFMSWPNSLKAPGRLTGRRNEAAVGAR